MKPSTALKQHQQEIKDALRARRAYNPRVFGSVLYGTDAEVSDLDLLVDTLPGATLFDPGGLQVDLEEILGVSVDLLTPGDLPEKFRDQVLREAKPIFAGKSVILNLMTIPVISRKLPAWPAAMFGAWPRMFFWNTATGYLDELRSKIAQARVEKPS